MRTSTRTRPQLSPELDEAAVRRAIVRHVDQAFGSADAIILYGSRTPGDARDYSDWDVLVMVDDAVDLVQARQGIRRALWDLGERLETRISALVLRWADADDNAGLLRNVLREGVPLT